MLEVRVCVGTSCHLRGAERVAERLTGVVAELGLQQQVQVVGAFCLEHCSDGVTVKVGDRFVDGVNASSVREKVAPAILEQVRGGG